MSLNVIRIDRNKHVSFLADHTLDPVTKQMFQIGDEVVVCARCKTAYMKDVWLHSMHGKCCGQRETADRIKSRELDIKIKPKQDDASGDVQYSSDQGKYKFYFVFFVIVAIFLFLYSCQKNYENDRLKVENFNLLGHVAELQDKLGNIEQENVQYKEELTAVKGLVFRVGKEIRGRIDGYDSTWKMFFDVYYPVEIDYVYVYPKTTGQIEIQLYNYDGVVVYTKNCTLNRAKSWKRVPLGFKIYGEGKYYLGYKSKGWKRVDLSYNLSNSAEYAQYKNSVIKMSGAGQNVSSFNRKNYYQYFYDWHYSLL